MSREIRLETFAAEETQTLGRELAPALAPGDVISLTGDLGAGKTCFTQGVAAGLGIERAITSPTFNIIREYRGRLPLYHFDVFRLRSADELLPLGYEDYFYGPGVTIIEWGDKIAELLPADYLRIEFHRTVEAEDKRLLIVSATGARSEILLHKFQAIGRRLRETESGNRGGSSSLRSSE